MKDRRFFPYLLLSLIALLPHCTLYEEEPVYGSLRSVMGKRVLCGDCYNSDCDCTPDADSSFNACHDYCYEYYVGYLYKRCEQEMPEEGKGSLNAVLAGCYAIADYATEEEMGSCEYLNSALSGTPCPN